MSLGDTLMGLTADQVDATLSSIAALGMTWIRVDLDWNDVQPTASSYDWSGFDTIVQRAAAHGLQVLPIVDYTPPWARAGGCGSEQCPPAEPAQFATFAGAAASRYGPRGVHTWEVWNEPNSAMFWQPAANVNAYVGLLSVTSRAIRGADPGATVISGGLASESTEAGNIAQLDFLSAFCQAGGASYVDGIGYHPYSFPVPPSYSAPWNAWTKIDATSPSMESVLVACGQSAKKIWITEYGAPTGGPGAEATTTNYNLANDPDHVSEDLQAEIASQSVQLARTDPNVAALFWYSYRDLGTDSSTNENFFGLLRADGTAKPAWNAIGSAIAAG